MQPINIRNVLQEVLTRTGMDERIEECRALLLWNDIASNLAARTEPVGVRRGRMAINVTDSVVLHQLAFYKKAYIDKINLAMGKRIIKDIVFRVGIVGKEEETGESREDYIQKLHNIQLEQDELTRIDKIVAQVEDEDIGNSLRELFISQTKLSKIRSEGA